MLVMVLGTLVIFTFDPCLDPSSTLSVCSTMTPERRRKQH